MELDTQSRSLFILITLPVFDMSSMVGGSEGPQSASLGFEAYRVGIIYDGALS